MSKDKGGAFVPTTEPMIKPGTKSEKKPRGSLRPGDTLDLGEAGDDPLPGKFSPGSGSGCNW